MRASVGDFKFLAATAGLVILTFIAPGQTLAPGEVRISSRPYQPQPQLLRAESRLVRIGAVVRDGEGQVVSGLKREDFAIYDDGKRQGMAEFSIEKRLLRGPSVRETVAPPPTQPNLQAQEQPLRPRYVALYFDDLDTRFGDMRHVQVAAENFIHQGVGPEDKVGLFTASGSETVDFTPDAVEILSAIEKLKFRGRTIASSGCPRITPYDAYEIATEPEPPITPGPRLDGSPTYVTIVGEAVQCNCIDETNLEPDCISQQKQTVQAESKQMWSSIRQMSQDTLNTLQAVVDYLAKRPGERVLVLASLGFLTGTLEDRVDAVVDNALRAGVVINALDAKGLYTNEPSHGQTGDVDTANVVAMHEAESFGPAMASATAAMVDFAVGTGGRFFHNRNDLNAGYYSLAAAPETEYLLGFAPENRKLNGGFHRLKVELNRPGKFYVQARPGYFAPTKEMKESNGPTPEKRIDAEVRDSDERSDFPLSVSERSVTASNGGRELSVQNRVDIQKLPFELQKDRHMDMLTFVIALFDSQGRMIAGKEAQMELALKPESFERFSKNGIIGVMSLAPPPDHTVCVWW